MQISILKPTIWFSKLILFFCLIFLCTGSISATEVKFNISINIENIGTQVVTIGDMFSNFDSVTVKKNNFELSGTIGEPKILRILFSKGGFLLVYVDTNNLKITGKYPFLKFYDFDLISSVNSVQNHRYMKEINSQYAERYKNSNASKLDSIENNIAYIIMSNIIISNSNYLNQNFLAAAKILQKNNFYNQCLETIKSKYSTVNDFVKDYPAQEGIIRELFDTINLNIDTSLVFQTIKKEVVRLSTIEKKYILFDIWADWCIPCIEAFPALKEIESKFNDVKILSLAMKSRYEKVVQIVSKNNITTDVIFFLSKKEEDAIAEKFQINLYPTYILCNTQGEILLRKFGADGLKEIREYLESKF